MDDRGEQVVGGVLPDQADTGGNFSQAHSGAGPGWRPVVDRERADRERVDTAAATEEPVDEATPAQTAGGGYGTGSGYGSSGGSQGGGENQAVGGATAFARGETANDLEPGRLEPGRPEPGERSRPPDGAIPPDVEGE